MSKERAYNRRIVLAKRPHGAPVSDDFRLENLPVPVLTEGRILLRTVYLSLDPYMRGRMSDAPSYAEPVKVDAVMVGATVCQVEASLHPDYKVGEWVLANSGWQDYMLSDGTGLTSLGETPQNPSYALGILGMPGFTAYMGLLDIGQPRQNETLVIAAATGPVGATVGQIAKLKGCHVVGVAGNSDKCKYAKEILGFDECLDHKSLDFAKQLKKVCSRGIDIYFESVGGKVFDAVLPLLNTKARVPVCGIVSQYNATRLPYKPNRLSLLMGTILIKRLTVQGFIIFDYYDQYYDKFTQDMTQWLSAGQIKYRENMVDDLESAPEAFIGMLEGKNFGKLVVQVNNKQ
jgi:NADPH-dependent curcumin reductase CurA